MPFIKVNEINIWYETHGEGFPLVMIMGLSANLDWWGPHVIETLSKRFKLVIFDNRGAGRTDKPDTEYSIKMFASDTARLMDALKIKRAHVLGLSMGGMIAQELVLNYPEKVEKLVLCSTNCGFSKSVLPSKEVMEILMSGNKEMTPEESLELLVPLLYTEDFIKNNPDVINASGSAILIAPIPAFAYQRQVAAVMKFKTGRRLNKVDKPTLIMHGKKDVLVPVQNAEILANYIPNAEVAIFDNSAHGLFSQEPNKILSALLKFLS